MSPGSEKATGEQRIPLPKKMTEEKFVAALDVGTTTIRCCIFDQKAQMRASVVDQIELLYPKPGFVEIDPDKLWSSVLRVISDSIECAGLSASEVTCLGISVQRSSFITWNKHTGLPYHNIVIWRDLRANKLVKNLNKSFLMRGMRATSRILYTFTRNQRFLAGSQLKVMNTQVTPRLLWMLNNIPGLQESVDKNEVFFGTLDTWLVYKLTGGKLHVTDVSNAACTGFFDPFTMSWANWAFYLFGLPRKILPEVLDTSGDFGSTVPNLFGHSIPIRSCVADQSASLFGSCGFHKGDLKITLGTGSFVDINTGDKPHASVTGLYPVVGWRIKKDTVYMVEGASNDTGTTIKWAQRIGIINDPSESSDLAESVEHSDGVYFVPSFSGLQAPINDGLAAAGLIGIKPTTTKAHMMRAILESIAFRIHHLYELVKQEINAEFKLIRIDGGVSQNDFVTQLVADLTDVPVERPGSTEMSALGAAYLAGLSGGVWNSMEELTRLRKLDRKFIPRSNIRNEYQSQIEIWRNAISRFLNWYPEMEY